MKKIFLLTLAVFALIITGCDENDPANSKIYDIQITKVASTKIEFTIAPVDPKMGYGHWVMSLTNETDNNGDLRADVQQAFETLWKANGYTYDDYLKSYRDEGTVKDEWEVKPDADCFVLVFQCDENNKVTVMAYKSVHTLYAGALHGMFSVGDRKKVRFSQGNLQHWWAPGSAGYWLFANRQEEVKGDYNAAIANTNTAMLIDLFGWGTGSDDNNLWKKCTDNVNDYAVYHEWGDNPIKNGGDKAFQWRTLTFS